MADAQAIRKARTLLRWAVALQVSVLIGAIVSTAFGVRIQLPTWLIIGSSWGMFFSTAMRPIRPKISNYLMAAAALLSISTVIAILIARP